MLKITENFDNGNTVRLRLDGTISDEAFRELVNAWSRHRDGARPTIILDMSGVEFMSNDSARKLTEMRGDGCRIINCSPFIEMLLETMDRQDVGQ